MTVLVDSDILIEVMRARDASIVTKWQELSESEAQILFSPVSAAELGAGARAAERDRIEALFRALQCVPVDTGIGREAGILMQRYDKSRGVELGDALIGASAVSIGAKLWTRNRRHYPMKELSFF